MSYNSKELKPYIDAAMEVIPLYPWNKQVKGKERGKTPVHNEWTVRPYKSSEVKGWIDKGLNLGVRIKENQLVVDLDPRNYVKGKDSPQLIAELFGYWDFEEMLWELPVVKTGSGGYHIYFNLPHEVDHKLVKTKLKEIPGVDFKKKGGYVVAAGSRHPNGEYYKWENIEKAITLTEEQLKPLIRPKIEKDYTSGYGALNGTQLQELILDKLDITEYSSNDEWFPILCASHHATAGDGIEEFLDWSLGDSKYSGDENTIRNRWESMHDDKAAMFTVGTLIHQLEQRGDETNGIKAMLTFNSKPDYSEMDEEGNSDDEEASILKEAGDSADSIDLAEMMGVPKEKAGVEGSAQEFIAALPRDPSHEDVMKAIRLIKASSSYEAKIGSAMLVSKTPLSKGDVNSLLKEQEERLKDSIAEVIANTTIKEVFNSSKHIITEPDKLTWVFNKTHWRPIEEEYLGKIVYQVLDKIKSKLETSINEQATVSSAVKSIRMRTSVMNSKIHSTDKHRAIINCLNGELELKEDGSHSIRPHKHNSYQISCIKANYDPSCKGGLFLDTINDIFSNFLDQEDMVRHLAEVMGYIVQPNKPHAAWWLFKGPGGDGKSTIVELLNIILGNTQMKTDVSVISALGGSSKGQDGAIVSGNLLGKLNVVVEEIPKGSKLNDAGLKLLAGGGNPSMQGRFLYSKPFNFKYVGSLVMCANHFPYVGSHDGGTMRRANVIPFNAEFHRSKNLDINRVSKIRSDPKEISAMLNYMLEGYERLCQRGGFLVPESCRNATEEWLLDTSNVARFMKEETKTVEDSREKASDVWDNYKDWSINSSGTQNKGKTTFYRELEDLKYELEYISNTKYVLGVKLKNSIRDFDEFES